MKLKAMHIIGVVALLLLTIIPARSQTFLEEITAIEAKASAAAAALAASPQDAELIARNKAAQGDVATVGNRYAAAFGANWRTRWQNSAYPDPDDEMGDIYLVTPFSLAPHHFAKMSLAKRQELAAAIAAKPTLVVQDLQAIKGLPYTPALVARLQDFAALLPSGTIRGKEYYTLRNIDLLKRKGPLEKAMLTPEWIDMALANSPIPPRLFTAGREYLMLKITKALMDTRAANNLSTSGPEFDAALAPILTSLTAPKFAGLRAATLAAGIDLGIPDPLDTTAPEALAAAAQDAATRRATFLTPWGAEVNYTEGLGSVMLVLGQSGYETWRQQVLGND